MHATRVILLGMLISAATLLTGCSPSADWYHLGKTNFTRQHYQQALPQLLWSAEAGNAQAEYAVGYMYFNGLGTPTDDILAHYWFSQAAKSGNANAIGALGKIKANMEGFDTSKPIPHPRAITHHHSAHTQASSLKRMKLLPVIPTPHTKKS